MKRISKTDKRRGSTGSSETTYEVCVSYTQVGLIPLGDGGDDSKISVETFVCETGSPETLVSYKTVTWV